MTTEQKPDVLVARKPLVWNGKKYKPGQELKPQPEGLMREKLLRGLFVVVATEGQTPPTHLVGTPKVPRPPRRTGARRSTGATA